ncbi:MAG TPA: hypothetical protein VFG68_13135 [Fimbriiglobus sp.]|nr:hypothetical protein [Fimbriiglobus sp.]
MSTTHSRTDSARPTGSRTRGPRRTKHNKSLFTFSAPAGIEEALRPHLPKKKPRVWLAKCLYVVAALKQEQFKRSVESEDWVPLYSVVLAEIVGCEHRTRVIKLLEDAGVVAQHRHYKVGRDGEDGESMKYRFTPRFWDAPVVPVVIDDRHIVRNLDRAANRQRKAIDRDDLLRPMAKSLAHFHVENWPEDRGELREGRERGFGQNLKRSGKGQRAYHELTNTARELRQYVRVDGKQVWAADCACSQPLLFGLFLWMAQEGDLPDDLPDELKAAAAKLPEVDADELDRYIADCQQGSLYDDVKDASGVPRILVKLGWMTRAFGVPEEVADDQGWAEQLARIRDPVARQVGNAFVRLYPSVYGCLKRLWKVFRRGGLPKLLQRFESWLYLDRLTARLHAEYPEAVFSSVHDSILGVEETVTRFKAEIEHEYRVLFGVVPLVKVEPWSKPQPPKTCYEHILFEQAPEALKDEVMKWLAHKLIALDKKHPHPIEEEEPSNTSHRFLRFISAKVLPYVVGIGSTQHITFSSTSSCVDAVPGQNSVAVEQIVDCQGDADYEELLARLIDLTVENHFHRQAHYGYDEPTPEQVAAEKVKEEKSAREFYPAPLSLRRAIWAYEADPDESKCPF